MNLLQPTTIETIEFLTYLFKQGRSHGQISSARSALSSIISLTNSSVSFGNLPLVKRLMKGIYEAKPNLRNIEQFGMWVQSLIISGR